MGFINVCRVCFCGTRFSKQRSADLDETTPTNAENKENLKARKVKSKDDNSFTPVDTTDTFDFLGMIDREDIALL